MTRVSTSPPADWAAQLAAERNGRLKAEAALKAAQANITFLKWQLEALVQNLQVDLVLVDPLGQTLFINPYFRELFGLEENVVLATSHKPAPGEVRVSELFQDPEKFREQVLAMHSNGKTVLQEEFTMKDGRILEVNYLASDQNQSRLICYRDVTERHNHAAQLRVLSLIPEQNPNPILRLSTTGKLVYTNPAAMRLIESLAADASDELARLAELVRAARRTTEQHQQEVVIADQYFLVTVVAVPDMAYATLYLTNITARRHAEQQLAQQRTFYETILNLLPVDIAVFDAEHRYLFANPSSISDPGLRRVAIGMTSEEYLSYRQRPLVLAEQRETHFQQALRTRQDAIWEETLSTPQGPKRVLRNLRPVFHTDGSFHLMVGSGLDITERYKAEERQRKTDALVREQKAFIRLIVDTLPNVLYVAEANGSISFANAAYEEIRPLCQHASQPSENLVPTLALMAALDTQVLTTGKPLTTELPFQFDQHDTRHFQIHKRTLSRANGQPGVLTICTDISAIKQARQATERREKQYHDLVYYSQALICTHDLDGNILSANPAIERLMGLPAEMLVGRNLREALPQKHQDAVQTYLDGIPTDQSQASIMAILTATEEKRYLHYYTYRVEEEGQAPYIVASGYDVTQGVHAERALRQAKQEAEDNARAKETFLALMSHEIRTPLNGVLGMATLLKQTSLTGQQQEYLHIMERAGKHLLALVNDVLDMAKITANQLELDSAPFDVQVAMQGAGQIITALAEQKGLQLIVDELSLLSTRVLGDAYRLNQVLLNLLSNAVKFTEQGCVRLGADIVSNTPQELTLQFWVRDTGIGISFEQQQHIFDAFTQASSETSKRFGGTGLGLTISQQLVQRMGGELTVSSSPGEGTTFSFTLTLPYAEETGNAPELAESRVFYEKLAGLRVLLAEDNLVNQWLATVMLEHWGVLVYAVGNGTDALTQLQTTPYDVGILDIQMPGLSGVEVATAIRQFSDPTRAQVPLIALTANAFQADRESYLAAGMNACLTKPFEEAALCQLLLDLANPVTRSAPV